MPNRHCSCPIKLVYAILIILFAAANAYGRDINLYAVCYGLSKITLFDEEDRKIEITDRQALLHTIKEYADVLIDGRLSGNDYSIAYSVPTIFYMNGLYYIPYLCNHPAHHNYPLCTTFSAHPEWRLTAHGNRLFRWAYECFEVMNVGHPAFQLFMGSHAKNVLAHKSFFQGVFVDDVSGHFNQALFGFHKTIEQAIVQRKEEGLTFVTVKHTINQSKGPCSAVIVKKSDGTHVPVEGVWHGRKTVFLKSNVRPGDHVTVTYYSNAPDWQAPDDTQWTQATAGLLARIKQAIGDKLLVYNGTQLGYTYDREFLRYADGCMREGFVEGKPSLQQWKADIDRLADISRNKMYFTLTYVQEDLPLDVQLQQIWFTYASFLLGNNGKGYFAIARTGQHALFHKDWNRNIGKPRTEYREQGNGVFVREYEHAYVAVNPGEKAASVAIPSRFYAEHALPKPLILGPRQGMVTYRSNP